ncbi:MAG: apolipoprotein N-acyltransferase [Elusimicrobia bacterium]|nr:apolipoprotein N-acyltransferase [Elusimicrobiota bacterium]
MRIWRGALLSGILYALCFPKFSLGWCLGWLCLIPFFWAIRASRGKKEAFFSGFLCGWTAYLIILYWIPVTVRMGGGNIALAVVSWVFLPAILALFAGGFALLAWNLPRHWPPMVQGLCAAGFWVAVEWARSSPATLLGGFPWCTLGYVLVGSPWFLQLVEIGGVPLLGFLLVFAQWGTLAAIEKKSRRSTAGILAFCAAAGLFGGFRFYALSKKIIPTQPVVIAQGNIYQYDKWNEEKYQRILSVYRGLASQAIRSEASYLIYPESSYPELMDIDGQSAVSQISLERMLKDLGPFGSMRVIAGVVMADSKSLYNSALLIQGNHVLGFSHKKHLVPFGEYFPWAGALMPVLRFLHGGIENPPVLNAVGNFTPDQTHRPLSRGIGVTICYEAIFPEIFRNLRRQGASWLVNMTNDGWYLDTAAPYQHLMMNIPRAVENRLPLARAANTGISAVIDPLGRVTASSRLDEQILLEGRLMRLSEPCSPLWSRIQASFPWMCCAFTLLFLVMMIMRQ